MPTSIKVLLAAGAAVDARSNGNFTALMFAVRQDAREAVRLLVAAGADVNLTGPNAQDVLRLAITNRHYTLAADAARRRRPADDAGQAGQNTAARPGHLAIAAAERRQHSSSRSGRTNPRSSPASI